MKKKQPKNIVVSFRVSEDEKAFIDSHGKNRALRRALEIYIRKIREVERAMERLEN